MKNKTVTITADQLNTSGVITIDSAMAITQISADSADPTITLFPKEFQCINNTGVDLEYNTFGNNEELSILMSLPPKFQFV